MCHCGGYFAYYHHPFTCHSAWCPMYGEESPEARQKNTDYWNAGGYYNIDKTSKLWKEALNRLGGQWSGST